MKTKETEPILIRKDNHLIKEHHNNFQQMLKDGQEVYGLFKNIGIEITPREIFDLLHVKVYDKFADRIYNLVADKIIIKAGNPEFNGIKIKESKLREMVEVPDTNDIVKRLMELGRTWGQDNNLRTFKHAQIQIKDDLLTHIEGLHEEIESKHTHYTQTKKGHEIAAKLLQVSKDIIELSEFFGVNDKGRPIVSPKEFTIPGLLNKFVDAESGKPVGAGHEDGFRIIDKKHVGHELDLSFIRKLESFHEKNK